MAKAAKSFAEFSKEEKQQRGRCFTCQLPGALRQEVHEARAGGGSVGAISRWLERDRGTLITESALRKHFLGGHDKR